MTRRSKSSGEGSSGLIWLAIVISLLIHASGMLFMRPQTMTEIFGSGESSRSRKPMRVSDRPDREDAVRLEVVPDVNAKVDFPRVENDAVLPEVDSSASPLADSQELSLGVKDELERINILKMISDPSEIISRPIVDENSSLPYSVSPIAPDSDPGFGRPPVVAAARLDEGSSPLVQVSAPEVVTPPVNVSSLPMKDRASELSERTVNLDLPSEIRQPFIPRKEVMAEVDEKIVESEKSAVRALLAVKDARELKTFVNAVASSATRGDWTYFKVSLTPRSDLKIVPKVVVILFDASGSITEERLKSCRENARIILRSCMNTNDRFNLVAFRDDFEYAFSSWQNVNAGSLASAERWMRSLAAHGRTDVFASVASVLKLPRDPTRPLIALVVTDGIANKGVSETSKILSRFTKLNDGLISVYMYGVKDESNRELINILTRGNRGESFIYEGRRKYAGRDLEPFSDRFRDPVLSDLRVIFTSDSKAEVYPALLKNLYRGDVVDIVGRVPKGTREVAFSLKGLSGETAYEGFFRFVLSEAPFNAAVPDLWTSEKAIDLRLR